MISALALAASLVSQAPSQAVVADLGLHVLGVAYHRSYNERVIGSVSVDLYVPWTFTQNSLGLSGTYRSDLAGIIARARVYFVLWRGLWVSPFLQGGVARATEAGVTTFGSVAAAGATVGYAVVLWEHLLISGGLGVQVHGAWVGGRSPPSFLGAWPAIDLIAGYIW
ncbi:MAG: hypothetical protein Q8L48_04670 [Archangium sp.]|nr:hypothetical protein [Archangium sp.]